MRSSIHRPPPSSFPTTARRAPLACEVEQDNIYYLTPGSKLRLPITPPPFRNHGNAIISLSQFSKCWRSRWRRKAWTCSGASGPVGALRRRPRCGGSDRDRGVGKDGQPRGSFEPGADIRAKVTIFADGVRGHLTKQLTRQLQLGNQFHPGQYAIGLKELWRSRRAVSPPAP
ncbi:MAG: hypothetical protein R2712_06710 [Vicinamibacterales bacterium]